jgi:uncharacterized protein (TIGR03086 family)
MVSLTLLAALDAAVAEFRRRLTAVAESDWAAATPCTDWDVRYLVAHVVGGNRFASLVLGGATSAEAMDVVMSSPQLGADPLSDFDASAADQRDRFGGSGVLASIVSHPLGELPGERFLRMRVFDVAVHAWDLAVALGLDATLDDELTRTVIAIVEHESPGMGFGIEPCGDVGPDATAMERLLDLSGRCAQHVRG